MKTAILIQRLFPFNFSSEAKVSHPFDFWWQSNRIRFLRGKKLLYVLLLGLGWKTSDFDCKIFHLSLDFLCR